MVVMDRRHFLKFSAAGGALLTGCAPFQVKDTKAHVVVIGGGFGGATAAKTLRLLDANLKITLIEPKTQYVTCPGSNWLFAGITNLTQLSVDYRTLQVQYDIDLVTQSVATIERNIRQIRLTNGDSIGYDRLILSPGITFKWDAIAGYSAEIAAIFPHAWQAGLQTRILAQQLQAMPQGGVVLIVAPPDPYRCPPGPYERASMMACWIKQHNPRAKILILDSKRSFSKQRLFEAGWRANYGYGTANSLIEWHSLADNSINELHKASKTVISEFGDRFTGDVLNIIPAQMAANLAMHAGLTNPHGWCDINPLTSQSVEDDCIHVIGDAAQFTPMPKSAFAANSQAKACAMAVFNLIHQQPMSEPHWINTCYSLIAPEQGISVVGVYRLDDEKRRIIAVEGAGGVSHAFEEQISRSEAGYARSVYQNLIKNSFG
ncbi:MAG: flavocytochrome c sulfide dehydrogenase flavin-binding protein [Methylomonas sp.]|nr:MAG: flavocytochrome c sulfide dehydrogenase flavin-binding protein [Methylomonas sp.]